MRSTLLLSTFGCAFFSAVCAFEFTGPDSTKKLDLTKPINITWNAKGGSLSEPKATALDIWFRTHVSDGWQGQEIASNLSLSSGLYEWNPEEIVKGFQDDDVSVLPDADHYFEARLVDDDWNELATVTSEHYALEGYDFIRNGGGKATQPGLYTSVAAALMVGVMASGIL